jgi:hypothetical protein
VIGLEGFGLQIIGQRSVPVNFEGDRT